MIPKMSRGAQWAAWSVAAVVAIVHLAVAGQYDIFRNELYFIVCGRHPAFGYVDQPPLVPLLAAVTQFGGVGPQYAVITGGGPTETSCSTFGAPGKAISG